MPINVQEIDADLFPLYDAVPNWFRVASVFRVQVVDAGLGGFKLIEDGVAVLPNWLL